MLGKILYQGTNEKEINTQQLQKERIFFNLYLMMANNKPSNTEVGKPSHGQIINSHCLTVCLKKIRDKLWFFLSLLLRSIFFNSNF
jgi:restriction endonuclease S subunit